VVAAGALAITASVASASAASSTRKIAQAGNNHVSVSHTAQMFAQQHVNQAIEVAQVGRVVRQRATRDDAARGAAARNLAAARTATRKAVHANWRPPSAVAGVARPAVMLRPVPSVAAPVTRADAAAVAAEFATERLGVPYVYGGTGPDGYDCSGLTMAAWRAAGSTIPRTSQGQATAGIAITREEIVAGDLIVYYGGGHVAIAIDNASMIHAPQSGESVSIAPIDSMEIYAIRRIA
jgi:cell wall-associated NlpC family hydrolase